MYTYICTYIYIYTHNTHTFVINHWTHLAKAIDGFGSLWRGGTGMAQNIVSISLPCDSPPEFLGHFATSFAIGFTVIYRDLLWFNGDLTVIYYDLLWFTVICRDLTVIYWDFTMID